MLDAECIAALKTYVSNAFDSDIATILLDKLFMGLLGCGCTTESEMRADLKATY